MSATLRRIADSKPFQNLITAVILFAGVVVGIETFPAAVARIGGLLDVLNVLILGIFVIEIVVKMGAEGRRPWRYFMDPWNVFDFAIVAVCFLPVDSSFVAVLRLARLMRVLKLVRAIPKLQILVGALLKSIPSMGYVAMLLGLLFYIYAVAAVVLFGENDPIRFASLPTAILSLFTVVTGEGWTEVMYVQMYGCDVYGYGDFPQLCTNPKATPIAGAIFFVTFMLLGAMIILNLFIGVIMNGMEEAREENAEAERERREALGIEPDLAQKLGTVVDQLSSMQQEMLLLKHQAEQMLVAKRDEGAPTPGATAEKVSAAK